MNDCCAFIDDSNAQELDTAFNEAVVTKDLKRYLKHGPRKSSRILVSLLQKHRSRQDTSLCDIGSGIGSVAHAFLNHADTKVSVVESSSAYIKVSQEEARRQGNYNRIEYYQGDYTHLASDLGPHDVVCLDRVICCYPDMDTLLGLSAVNTKSLLAIVIPRDTIFHRMLVQTLGIMYRVGTLFNTRVISPHFYMHRMSDINETVRWCGLAPLASKTTFFWRIALYQRSQP